MKTKLLFLLFLLAALPAFSQGAWSRENHLAEAVSTPRVLTISNAPVLLFGTNDAAAADGRTLVRKVQNVGTSPFYYLLHGTNHLTTNIVTHTLATNISTTNLHGIVAGGVAANDGLGSILDLSRWRFGVWAVCPSGNTTLIITELTQ